MRNVVTIWPQPSAQAKSSSTVILSAANGKREEEIRLKIAKLKKLGKISSKKGEERVAKEAEIVGKKESIADKYASRVEDVLEKAKRDKDMRDKEREDERREDERDRRAQEKEEREEVERVEALLRKKREEEREGRAAERAVKKEEEKQRESEKGVQGEVGMEGEKTTTGIGGSWSPDEDPEADYKPARGSWGVFERPRDISRAYGGGKRVGRGVNESEERRREREMEEQETQARLARYRKQRGGVKPAIEVAQTAQIRESLDNSRAYMMRGMYKEAVEVLENVTPVCTTVTKLGVEVFLELGMAYEACSMPKEAKVCYSGVVDGGGVEGRKKAETLIFRMDAKELIDGGAKSGGRRKRVEFVDTSVLSELSSWDDKSYATTYVNLDKPQTRMERLEEVSVESEEEAIEILRSGDGGEKRARATAYLVNAWKRMDGVGVKKERVNPVINGRVIRELETEGPGGFVGNSDVAGEWRLEFKVVNGVGERGEGWCIFEDKGGDGFGWKYEIGGGWGWKGKGEGVGWKVEGRVNLEEDKEKKSRGVGRRAWEGLLKPKFPTVFDIVGTDRVMLLIRDVENGSCWGFRKVKDGKESRKEEWVEKFNSTGGGD